MILLPVLLMWFTGMFVFFDAFHKWMKSLKATYTVSDLLTRQLVIDDDFIFALDGIFDTISQSRDGDETWLRVSQVRMDDGALELLWTTPTYPSAGEEIIPFTLEHIRENIPTLADREYVVVIQSYRPFNPLFTWVGIDATTFSNTIVSPLRFTDELRNVDHPNESTATDEGIDTDDPDEAT
jgi:hypothetical protein